MVSAFLFQIVKEKIMKQYGKKSMHFTGIPQTKKLEPHQVKNNAGGFSYELDRAHRFMRFLILGTDGSFYSSEQKMTSEALKNAEKFIVEYGGLAIDMIENVSTSGRAIRNDEAIYALVMCFVHGDHDCRKQAADILPKVIRTGTHMFQLIDGLKSNKKSGRLVRDAIAKWYNNDINEIAYQVLKYRSRLQWTHLDVIRLAHPKPTTDDHDSLFAYLAKNDLAYLPTNIDHCLAYGRMTKAETAQDVINVLDEFPNTPREFIKTEFLANKEVWRKMVDNKMPYTALIRNLGVMTSNGALSTNTDDGGKRAIISVVGRIVDTAAMARARMHPFQLLLAWDAYKSGKGMRGSTTWNPIPIVCGALEQAVQQSFKYVPTTGKSIKIGIDVSGSMSWDSSKLKNTNITAKVAAAVMMKATIDAEPFCNVVAFTGGPNGLTELNISKYSSLAQVVSCVSNLSAGSTDCALPILDSLQRKQVIDTFIIYTDNETWYGNIHPMEALRVYRARINPEAKLIVVGMVGNRLTIADPNDKGCLDMVGFDANAPSIISNFILGHI